MVIRRVQWNGQYKRVELVDLECLLNRKWKTEDWFFHTMEQPQQKLEG